MSGRLSSRSIIGAGVLSLSGVAGSAFPFGGTGSGPDVIVSTIGPTLTLDGTVGSVSAYSMTTVSCNLGEADAIWIDCTNGGPNCNKHPVIGQQMYRLKGGRFEQIGMSWLKHGFCAADANGCGSPYEPNASCDWLGTHATDTYSASLNGSQPSLGPRSEVNAFSGAYPYPYVLNWGATGNAIYKRLQINTADVNPAMNAGAQYYGESIYICTDEQVVNRFNNASYRPVSVGTASGGGWNLNFTGSTQMQQPALNAWKTADPGVTQTDIDVANDGRFILSSRATSLGGGQWHYEYALYNYNSHRSGQSFSIPLPGGVAVSNVGFHDVNYHSGEPYALTDWPHTIGAADVSWSTDSFTVNQNANALRWSTLYNFRFDANLPPRTGTATVALFRPGTPASVGGAAIMPDFDCNANNVGDSIDIATGTSADANGNAIPDECEKPTCAEDVTRDGVVNVSDLLAVIAAWGGSNPAADVNDDGIINVADLLAVIAAWGPC